jgi:hypothetical protein
MKIKKKWLRLILLSVICYYTILFYPQPASATSRSLFGIHNGLVRIDPVTGTVTSITSLSISTSQGISTLDPVGHKYFFIGIDNSSNPHLFSINTQTGEVLASPVVPALSSIDFEALFPPVPVPTIHDLGLLTIAISLGASGIYFMKRRGIY